MQKKPDLFKKGEKTFENKDNKCFDSKRSCIICLIKLSCVINFQRYSRLPLIWKT